MHTTYGMDTCIETNEILAFGMEVYSRYIPDICKNLEYVRHIPDICLTYDTIRIPDGGIWQYMQNYITVYGSTLWYIMMAVHFSVYHGLWQYMTVH